MNAPLNVVPLFLPSESEQLCQRRAVEIPAYRPIVERLKEESPVVRKQCACQLAELFRRRLYTLDLTEAQAKTIVAHKESKEHFIAAEFLRMQADEKWKSVYMMWQSLWCDIADSRVRTFTRYAAAMLARLYYLEPTVYMHAKRHASTVA